MKKVTALVLGLFLASFSMNAASDTSATNTLNYNDDKSYIFVEGGVEFSIYTDGQFDFVYVGDTSGGNVNISLNTPGVSVSFNSGYDYDAYVQYDDYGAVIQVEDVAIYYDEFGRITQAGEVEIRYNNRRIVRVGGQRIFYNSYGHFDYYSGFISPWYRTYVFRPWHIYYARPFYTSCIVYDYPYRRYYSPVRYSYSYHRNYYNSGRRSYINGRRSFHRPGSRHHYKNGRTAINRDYKPNRRNTAVSRLGNNKRSSINARGNTRGNVKGNTSRGVAKRNNSSNLDRKDLAKRGGNASSNVRTTKGIAKRGNASRDIKRSGYSKSVGSSNRGSIAKSKGSRSVSKRSGNNRNNSVKRQTSTRRSTASRGNTTSKRSNSVKRSSSSNKRSNAVKRSAPSNKRSSTASRSKKTPSRSKGTMSRKSSSSRSKGAAPRRGRGL